MFRILDYIRVKRNFFFRKRYVSFSLSLELADIEHKVQAGMFVSQIFKSVCTSEQSDQTSHFLPIDRPSKSDQTAWMGTHVNRTFCLTQTHIKVAIIHYCVHL